MGGQEFLDIVVGDLVPLLLVLSHQLLQDTDEDLLDLAGEHLARRVLAADPLQLFVILQEEAQVMEGDVDLQVGPVLLLLLFGVPATTEGPLDFLLDFLGFVDEEDARVRNRGRHLGLEALQRGEELGVEACGLGGLEPGADVPGHPKVGVLVDATGDDARDVLVAEDVREAGGQARGALDGGVGCLTTVVGEVEPKDGPQCVHVDVLLHPDHILVHSAHVLAVDEDEGLLGVEAQGNDVLDVVVGELGELLDVVSLLPEELLVVGDLDHQRHVECLLQVFIEHERQDMAQVECLGGWPSASVQVERRQRLIPRLSRHLLVFLVGVEYEVEIPVSIEDASADEVVRGFASQFLDPGDDVLVDREAPELGQQFLVVDLLVGGVCDLVGVDDQAVVDFLFLGQVVFSDWCDWRLSLSARLRALLVHTPLLIIKEIIISFMGYISNPSSYHFLDSLILCPQLLHFLLLNHNSLNPINSIRFPNPYNTFTRVSRCSHPNPNCPTTCSRTSSPGPI